MSDKYLFNAFHPESLLGVVRFGHLAIEFAVVGGAPDFGGLGVLTGAEPPDVPLVRGGGPAEMDGPKLQSLRKFSHFRTVLSSGREKLRDLVGRN